ncbi:hypothetical protein ACFVYE_03150 [Streptomyces sp. NPDC058239]|uniref:hypothetical protein n=1 Tax=unclassified Streptomyces TaxID=2593676 RepID=UPI003649FD17
MRFPLLSKSARAAGPDTDGPQLRLGRRKVLGGVGASGLMAAAGIFAGAAPAAADSDNCCNLANKPGSAGYTTMTYCRAHMSYLWGCSMSGTLHCSCCETAGNAKSSFECKYN